VDTEADNDDDGFDESDMNLSMDHFWELQRSTGSEVLNAELQNEINQGEKHADAFLEAHARDASWNEKVAMSSIPEQLPRPAVEYLSQRKSATKVLAVRNKSKTLNWSSTPRVTPAEEIQLARRIQQGAALHKIRADFERRHGREITKQEWAALAGMESVSELRRQVALYRTAKQILVSANLGLVHAVIKTCYRSASPSVKEELVQEGSLGLLRAAELFDPARGLRFSTYATIWIKGILGNSNLVETIKLPLREKAKWKHIVKAYEDLSQIEQVEPTIEQVASHLKMKVSDVLETKRRMTQAKQVLSLDYEYQTHSRGGTETEMKESNLHHDKALMADVDLAERTQLHADVVAALARNLDSREARLMRLRFGLADGRSRSLSECAEAMGLSQTRVQQLANQCLKKLREAADVESLEEYLLTIA
jgi:RNA polymerase primary sigma factor